MLLRRVGSELRRDDADGLRGGTDLEGFIVEEPKPRIRQEDYGGEAEQKNIVSPARVRRTICDGGGQARRLYLERRRKEAISRQPLAIRKTRGQGRQNLADG
jgi:hypothetical protein